MPRILLVLFVALGFAALAVPASAHVHGAGHAPTTIASATALAGIAGHVAESHAAAAISVASALPDAPCDRDCAHGPAMAGCLCMAACIALALPDLPTIVAVAPAADPRPADAAPWRPTALVPPTPPPRA